MHKLNILSLILKFKSVHEEKSLSLTKLSGIICVFVVCLASDPPTALVQSTDTAAIIGGTLGAIAVLIISGIILLIIVLLQFNKRTAQSRTKL